jgi:murein DD-endopeptidase MepM/ murein hydrolase activator NlpD
VGSFDFRLPCLGGRTVVDWKERFNVRFNMAKRTILSTAIIATLTVGTVSADSGISTVFHVYANGERLGTVDSKEIVEQYIESKQKQLLAENPGLVIGLDDNIVYIQEKVFRPVVNNTQVLNKLSDNLEILAEAFAIVINEEPVAYVGNKENADKVLREMKLKYVTEEALAELESRDPEATLPPLAEGQSRILDVVFNEKVSIIQEKINPSEILSVEEAVTFLTKGTLEEKNYQVQSGDVLGSIASKHNLELKDLLALNEGLEEDSMIKVGQELNVTAIKSFLNVRIQEEVYKHENIPFTTEVKENNEMFKGDKKVKQDGQNGEKLVSYIVSKENGQLVEQQVVKEEVVKKPVSEIIEKGTKVVPSRGTGNLAWPAVGGYISSHMGYRWGRMHKGIDIARPSDRSILAADNGTVTSAGWDGGYGNRVVINHNNGLKTTYSHLSSINVSVGQTVSRGQKIGVMGRTGNSTGVHLHFEVYQNSKLVNPMNHLK